MIVYLKPRAPFAQSAPRSDTLFGAIAWAIRLLYGEGELLRLLEQFDHAIAAQSSPPFLISSLFPFAESGNGDEREARRTLFLPRPLLASNFDPVLDDRYAHRLFKKLNSAPWVSQSVFEALARGELGEFELWTQLLTNPTGSYRLHAGAVVKAEELGAVRNLDSLIVTGESARRSIDRLSAATDSGDSGSGERSFHAPFASARAGSQERTGFFFLMEPWPEVVETLKAALRFLGDRGFGGGVSVGRGHCEVEFDDRDAAFGHQDGERLVLLSLLHPSPADRRHFASRLHDCFARLERRKGFIESSLAAEATPVWKPTLVMFAEGATFPRDGERRLYGSLFKEQALRTGLSERLRINGLAYTVPMKLSAPPGPEVTS